METAERLRRDLHPVEVTIGDRVILGARAFVTDRRVVVYREAHVPGDHRQRPDIAFSADVTGDPPEPNRGSLVGMIEIETTEGTVRLNRGAGCGCHSVLKLVAPLAAW